jgi:spore coat protein U-like protein
MRRVLIATAAGAALLAGGSASAVNATTTFQVTATVLKTCSVNATTLAFGNYTPGGGPVVGSSGVNVLCTKTTPFTVALNGGTTTGGTVAQRLMANGANTLQYNLYTTNAYATVWGDGTGTSTTQSGAGTGLATPVAYTVYGQLLDSAFNQGAVPGSYTDTITVTVAY